MPSKYVAQIIRYIRIYANPNTKVKQNTFIKYINDFKTLKTTYLSPPHNIS